MGVIPTLRSIRAEDYSDAPDWFKRRFLDVLSPYVNEVTAALGGGLDPVNLGKQYADLTLSTSSTLQATFAPGRVVVKNNLKFKPRSVTLGKCQPATAPTYAQETWHDITTTEFQNGWVNFDATTYFGAAYCLRNGRVYLRGLIKSGTINTDAFVLPVGFRPALAMVFASDGNNAYLSGRVLATGGVRPVAGSNAYVSLENLSFEPTPGTWASLGPFGAPQWSLTANGTVQIDYIAGLSPNTTYNLTLVLE